MHCAFAHCLVDLRYPTVQEQAVGALPESAAGSQQNRDAIVTAGPGPLLAALLRPDEPALQQQAAGTLQNLACGLHNHKDMIMTADAVPLIVTLTNQLCNDKQQAH